FSLRYKKKPFFLGPFSAREKNPAIDETPPTPTPPPPPATTPNRGATIRYNNHTANTAHTPSGTNKLNDAKPNNFALNACNHRPKGGLSTVMNPLGSAATKKKLCHERSIDFTAAA